MSNHDWDKFESDIINTMIATSCMNCSDDDNRPIDKNEVIAVVITTVVMVGIFVSLCLGTIL